MKTIPLEDFTFDNVAKMEQANFFESKRVFPEEFSLLEELLSLYKIFFRSFGKKTSRDKIPVLQMYMICFRELIVSSQLMGEAHFSEAYTIISRASEAVGYAVVMNGSTDKANLWINNSGQKGFKKLFGDPFPKGNKLLHPTIFAIYDITRTFGSHANFSSTIHFISHKGPDKFEFSYCDLYNFNWMKRNFLFTIHSFFEFMVVFSKLFHNELNNSFKVQYETLLKRWVSYRTANQDLFKTQI
jgi:hypothetical protein